MQSLHVQAVQSLAVCAPSAAETIKTVGAGAAPLLKAITITTKMNIKLIQDEMKKLLLFIAMFALVSIDASAYGGSDGQTWTLNGSEWKMTSGMEGTGLHFKMNYTNPKMQEIVCDQAGLFAQWKTDKSTEFGYLINIDNTQLKLSGTLNADDIKAITSNPTLLAQYEYIDLSGATIVGDIDWTEVGLDPTHTLILPSSVTTTDLGKLQTASFACIAYFSDRDKKNLNVHCATTQVADLQTIVTSDMNITFMPKYTDAGVQKTDDYTSVPDNFIKDGVSKLPAQSINFGWLNISDFYKNVADELTNLNNNTHYVVVPGGTNNTIYNATSYSYNSNVWAVSTYVGDSPYSSQCYFADKQYFTTTAGSANFTKFFQSGHMADVLDMMTNDQKNASVNAFYGPVDDLSSITTERINSDYLDFSEATFSGTTYADLKNGNVKYLELPHSTDASSVDGTKLPSNVLEAIAYGEDSGSSMYAYSKLKDGESEGLLSHILAYDYDTDIAKGWRTSNINNSLILEGTYKDVIGYMTTYTNGSMIAPSTVDLTKSSFPNLKGSEVLYTTDGTRSDGGTDSDGNHLYIYATPDSKSTEGMSETYPDTSYSGAVNGLASLNTFSSTLEYLTLPTDDATSVLPTKSLAGCKKLYGDIGTTDATLTIPCNIKEVGAYAFNDCDEVVTLNISCVELMGQSACYQMDKLENANLPSTLRRIPTMCFKQCGKLEVIDLPEGLENIGYAAFEGNAGQAVQIKSIRFPNTLKTIEAYAFREAHGLTILSFPASLEEIGTAAFGNSEYIEEVYFLGTTPPRVASGAFDGRTTGQGYGTRDEYWSNCGVSREYYNGSNYKRAVLHYPIVTVEEKYTETDALANYAEALKAYNDCKAANSEVYANYEADYAKYLEQLALLEKLETVGTIYVQNNNYSGSVSLEDAVAGTTYYYEQEKKVYYVVNTYEQYPASKGYYKKVGDDYVEVKSGDSDYPESSADANTKGLYTYYTAGNEYISFVMPNPVKPTLAEGLVEMPTRPSVYVYDEATKTYSLYSGDYVEGTKYYSYTAGNNDLYGALYTDLVRNSKWTEKALKADSLGYPQCGEPYFDDNEDAKWPKGYYGSDNFGSDPYAGVKEFLLVAGYGVNEDKPTPVQEIDHIRKDIWYTVCFPFDLTEVQLKTTFGPKFELAEFSSVDKIEDAIVLRFKVNPMADEKTGVMLKKHKAYMIHPASGKKAEDGVSPGETSFTLIGVEETAEDRNWTTKQLLDFNIANGNKHANPGKSVSGGYSGIGDHFVFTPVSNSNEYDFTKKTGKRVLLPENCYFLGLAAGDTYPRYYQETATEAVDRDGGLWRKNVAVVLPPGTDFTAPESAAFTGTGYETWKSGFTCPEYVYTKANSAKQVCRSFEIEFVDEDEAHNDPVGIIEVKAEEEQQQVPARLQNRIYNLNGQYVGMRTEGLAPGIYIVNGKKFMVK